MQFCFEDNPFPAGISGLTLLRGEGFDKIPEALAHAAGMDALLANQTNGALHPGGDVDGDHVLQVDIVGVPLHEKGYPHVLCRQSHDVLRTVAGVDKIRLEARLKAEAGAEIIQARALIQA